MAVKWYTWPFDLEGDDDVQSADLLTGKERDLRNQVIDYLSGNVGKQAQAYPGQLSAKIPDLFGQAYDWYQGAFGTPATSQAIESMVSGTPSYVFGPEQRAQTVSDWEKYVKTPMSEAFRDLALPSIREGFNAPGIAYSNVHQRGVLREQGNFLNQSVFPWLGSAMQAGEGRAFQAGESAQGRVAQGLTLPGQLAGQGMSIAQIMQAINQQPLDRERQEYLRTSAEPGWAIQTMLGMQQPTTENIAFQGYNAFGDISQMALAAAMFAI